MATADLHATERLFGQALYRFLLTLELVRGRRGMHMHSTLCILHGRLQSLECSDADGEITRSLTAFSALFTWPHVRAEVAMLHLGANSKLIHACARTPNDIVAC